MEHSPSHIRVEEYDRRHSYSRSRSRSPYYSRSRSPSRNSYSYDSRSRSYSPRDKYSCRSRSRSISNSSPTPASRCGIHGVCMAGALMGYLGAKGLDGSRSRSRTPPPSAIVCINRERGYIIDPIYIDDPLFPANNVGRNCFQIHQCIKAFADAYSTLEDQLVVGEDTEWINVELEYPEPSQDDWVGVFSPANFNVTSASDCYTETAHRIEPPYICTAPIKYMFANHSTANYVQTGKAKLRFQIINQRSDFSFALFTGGLQNPKLVAVSGPISFANPKVPLYPRLAHGKAWDEYYFEGRFDLVRFVKTVQEPGLFVHLRIEGSLFGYTSFLGFNSGPQMPLIRYPITGHNNNIC